MSGPYNIAWLSGKPETALVYRTLLQELWAHFRLSLRCRFMPKRICTAGLFDESDGTPEQHAAIGDRILSDAEQWRVQR